MVDRTKNGERRWMDWDVNGNWKMEIAQCDGDGDGENMREMDMYGYGGETAWTERRTDEQTNKRTNTETRKHGNGNRGEKKRRSATGRTDEQTAMPVRPSTSNAKPRKR